jgi:hypothetical protein
MIFRRAILVLAALSAAIVAGPVTVSSALASEAGHWRVLETVTLPNGNTNFMTSHPMATGDVLKFPIPAPSDGYVNYMLQNYNRDLTDTTITATVSVSASDGATFVFPLDCGGTIPPSVRIEFQDTSAGAYQPTDYWWSDVQGATTLSAAVGAPVTLTADTTNLSDWSDINGTSATDAQAAFSAALKNVKEVSLSFGGGGCFAHGVAVSNGSATFQLWSFDIS